MVQPGSYKTEIRTSPNHKPKLPFSTQPFGGRKSLLAPLTCHTALRRETTTNSPVFFVAQLLNHKEKRQVERRRESEDCIDSSILLAEAPLYC